MRMKKILVLFCFLVFPSTSFSSSFDTISLSNGISFELPKNWKIISDNTRVTLDAYTESEFPIRNISTELPFAANLYNENGKTIGIMNVRIYPSGIQIEQREVKNFSNSVMKIIDEELKKNLEIAMTKLGTKILSWGGSKIQFINGKWVIITSYRRSSIYGEAIFKVTLARVLDKNKSYTLTASFDESHEFFLSPITTKIISSMQSR